MNEILRDLLWKKVVVYLEDILVFLDSKEQHEKDLKEVFDRLKKAELFYSPKKYDIGVKSVTFCGH